MFSRMSITKSTENYLAQIEKLKDAINSADAVIIGAGAGLSTSAGFVYTGERFEKYFSDFARKYGFKDMYSGGFYPYNTLQEHWAYWSRYIYINRYMDAPKLVYHELLELVKDKDYFVITTNVDHCFQKAGFDKKRLFYTQGDYGLFQCSEPCHKETYDNEELVTKMVESQGFEICNVNADSGKELYLPNGVIPKRIISSDLLPACPECGRLMTMNLRADGTFVENEGWHEAAERYGNFVRTRGKLKTLFLELGVGYNTPVIIKYPFWQMTARNRRAVYACLNMGEAACPDEIKEQSICIDGDIGDILMRLKM